MKVQAYTNNSYVKNSQSFNGNKGKFLGGLFKNLFHRKELANLDRYETVFMNTMKELKYKKAKTQDITPTLEEPFPKFFKDAFDILLNKFDKLSPRVIYQYKANEAEKQSILLEQAKIGYKKGKLTKEEMDIINNSVGNSQDLLRFFEKGFSFFTDDGKFIEVSYKNGVFPALSINEHRIVVDKLSTKSTNLSKNYRYDELSIIRNDEVLRPLPFGPKDYEPDMFGLKDKAFGEFLSRFYFNKNTTPTETIKSFLRYRVINFKPKS